MIIQISLYIKNSTFEVVTSVTVNKGLKVNVFIKKYALSDHDLKWILPENLILSR